MKNPRSAQLQQLIHRRDKVLAVLPPPTAAHARIMEKAGCEALFVGTGGVVGAYTGLADVGTATMTECVTITGWIAASVPFLKWSYKKRCTNAIVGVPIGGSWLWRVKGSSWLRKRLRN